MPVERGGPPLRRVASEDPSLSASANARLTSELQDVVRARRARLDPGQADPARAAHATHSTTVATLIDVRLGGVLTAAVIAVTLGVVLITRSTSVLVLVPVLLLLLGLTAGIVRMVNRMTASPEHPSADLAAQLEQEGVGDPDRLMTDLVDEFTPVGRRDGR